jgi:hypothetical protein
MPFRVAKDTNACPTNRPYAVKNSDTGKVHGCHPSEAAAVRQMRALYANVPEARQ